MIHPWALLLMISSELISILMSVNFTFTKYYLEPTCKKTPLLIRNACCWTLPTILKSTTPSQFSCALDTCKNHFQPKWVFTSLF